MRAPLLRTGLAFRSVPFVALLLAATSLMPAAARAASVTVPDDAWQLLVVPSDTAGRSVTELFGGALPMVDYQTTWALFAPLRGGGYAEPAPSATIDTGTAFWLIQRTGRAVTLDIPGEPPEALLLPGCLSSAGCISLPLVSRAGEIAWSAVGVPTDRDIPLADLRLMTTTGPCVDGCALDEGEAEGLTAGTLWSQLGDGEGYRELGLGDRLSPWEGFWIPMQSGATRIGDVELLVPLGELDLEYCA